VVDARRAALQPADDDQVGQPRVALAPPTQAAAAVAGEALAGTRAHRLVGGVMGRGAGNLGRLGCGTSGQV